MQTFRLFERTDGTFHPLIYGLATALAFASGKLWPDIEFGLWTIFLSVIGIHLYLVLRRPVNYTSMVIRDRTIEYVALGQRELIPFDEIAKLQVVRERAVSDTGIESKWVVYMLSGKRIEVMDEWLDRSRLMRAFRKGLPGFDADAARKGHRAWKEGVWPCFELQTKP